MSETFPFSIPAGNDLIPASSGTQSLGSASYPFNSIFGGHIMTVTNISGMNYSALTTNCYINVDTTGANRKITLPTAVGNTGKSYHIRKISSDGYNVVVSGTSSQTINGALTKEILYQYSSMEVISNGINWGIN